MTVSRATIKPTKPAKPPKSINSHTVKKGETLSKIAKERKISLQALIASNPQIKDPNLIKSGQEIKIPSSVESTGSQAKSASTPTPSHQPTATAASSAGALAHNTASGALRRNLMPNFQPESIDQVRNGSARLIRGSRGPAVRNLQELLNKNGANLATDGLFGPKTEQALLNFQRTRGLSDSAIAGPKTLAKLDARAPATHSNNAPDASAAQSTQAANGVLPDTSGMTEAQRYDHYARTIQENGGQIKTGPNERNIAALRVETDADTNNGFGRYDDRMVMLWQDENGNKRVREYKANTEPMAHYRGRVGEDANGDGRLDQGRLPAGHYEYRVGRSDRLGNVMRPTRSVMAERDTNHDGLFNDNAYASAGRSMLIHSGGNSRVGSAGCQTMPPSEYGRFWRDMNSDGNPGKVGYTVINVTADNTRPVG